MSEISNLPAYEARKLIGQKQISSTEIVKSCLEQYEKYNPNVNYKKYFERKLNI